MSLGEQIGERPWAAAVFHVLAHVEDTARLASSVFDAEYVAAAAELVGAADSRLLARDARVLAAAAATHEELARLQLLAWVFDDEAHARAHVSRDLADLAPADARDPSALAAVAADPAAEVLRCAALLEAEHLARLPRASRKRGALSDALRVVGRAAPTLAAYRLAAIEPLRLRGRVRGGEIWIGAPEGPFAVSEEHLSWQAAHEATVGEVSAADSGLDERLVEHAAVVLLSERARSRGLADDHRRWFAHFGAAPSRRFASLPPGAQRVVSRLRDSG